jgi:hypothetical protein
MEHTPISAQLWPEKIETLLANFGYLKIKFANPKKVPKS